MYNAYDVLCVCVRTKSYQEKLMVIITYADGPD